MENDKNCYISIKLENRQMAEKVAHILHFLKTNKKYALSIVDFLKAALMRK